MKWSWEYQYFILKKVDGANLWWAVYIHFKKKMHKNLQIRRPNYSKAEITKKSIVILEIRFVGKVLISFDANMQWFDWELNWNMY